MTDKSAIEWTDATWSPITGCDPISPGCKHCYAKRAKRMQFLLWSEFDWKPLPNALDMPIQRVGKRLAGRLLDGVLHDEYPEVRHA